MSAGNRRWRKKYPEGARAHWRVQEAIEDGVLVRQPCARCGEARVQAHHEDYARPLDVIWLCTACHARLHNERAGKVIGGKPRVWGSQAKPPIWPHRKRFQPAPKRNAALGQAPRFREGGLSYRRIAERLGVAASSVFKWLNATQYH